MLEQAMFKSIKKHFESLDYIVKAEVLNTDIVAIKDELTIIIEMKKTLNTTLMYQGVNRQQLTNYVYLAILKPSLKQLRSRQFKEKLALVKRLELGLIFVKLEDDSLEVLIDPFSYQVRKNKKKQKKLLKEFKSRKTAFNIAGVNKTKIITAYKEQALMIAYILKDGKLPLKEIKKITNNYKTSSILQKNYYHWFDRVERGVYQLNDQGLLALTEYSAVIDELIKE